MVHAFNPSTQEAEAGGSQNLGPAWSTELVLGQPELLHRETLCQKKKKKKKRKKKGNLSNWGVGGGKNKIF